VTGGTTALARPGDRGAAAAPSSLSQPPPRRGNDRARRGRDARDRDRAAREV